MTEIATPSTFGRFHGAGGEDAMPTYEYRCGACRHEFERFESITSEPRARCPVCGGAAERKLSGGIGLIFKGSGFYITDYRSESYKKAAEAEKKAAEGASSAGEGS